jgi:hypothetical protein
MTFAVGGFGFRRNQLRVWPREWVRLAATTLCVAMLVVMKKQSERRRWPAALSTK